MRGRRIAPRAPREKEFRDRSRQEGPSPINAADGHGASAESFSQRARRMSVHVPTAGRVQATSRVAKLCGLRPRTLSQRREGSTARSRDKPCPGATGVAGRRREKWEPWDRQGACVPAKSSCSLACCTTAALDRRTVACPATRHQTGGRRAGVEGCAWLVAAGSKRRPCGRHLPSTTRACPRPAGQAPGLDPRPLSSRSGVCGSSASTCGSTSGTREPGTASSSPTLTLPILGFIQMLSCQARYLSGSQ